MGPQSATRAVEAYFPPPEAQGGWRSLVPANQEQEPTAAQKKVWKFLRWHGW